MVEVDPSSTSSGNKSSTSTGMIVGSTLGSLAVVAMIAVGLHLNKTRRSKQAAADKDAAVTINPMNGLA